MRNDPLQQYAQLKQQLTDEKARLEARLDAINQVLGSEPIAPQAPESSVTEKPASTRGRGRGRGARGGNTISLREAVLKALASGPLARKDLAAAVEEVGYKFTTKNPLNSIGSVLYGKDTPVKSKGGKFYVDAGAAAKTSTGNGEVPAPEKKKKRKMSAAGRARIAAAAKAMWARRKAGK